MRPLSVDKLNIVISVKRLSREYDIFDCTCNWLRVMSGGWYFRFRFRSGYGHWPSLSGLGVRVRVHVRVWFDNVVDNSKWAFVGWFRAAWPARQHMGIVDSKNLYWIAVNWLPIYTCGSTVACSQFWNYRGKLRPRRPGGVLGWDMSPCDCCANMLLVELSSCYIGMETCCGAMERGRHRSWSNEEGGFVIKKILVKWCGERGVVGRWSLWGVLS